MKTVYQYRGGTITRIDYADGTKTFRASAGFPKPSPLYNLDELEARPGVTAIVVEGEKAADAAKKLFPDYVVVTSAFGAKSAGRTDWSPLLAGRRVILWRDADAAGIKYAEDVLRLVPDACLVSVNGKFPEGWDLADDVPAGVDLEDLLTTAAPAASQAKSKKNGKAGLHKSAEEAKRERDALFAKIRALRNKTVTNGCTEAEAEASANKAKELMAEYDITDDDLEFGLSDVEEDDFETESELRKSAAPIIDCKDVLGAFEAIWRKSMAGEVKSAKLLFLVATSRLFDHPMHAAIKGPSAAGKSEVRKRVLKFFPSEAVLSFTMLSERALLYFERDFCHMILSMGEAAGAEEQTLQDYLLRELMSDGKLRYPVAVKTKDGLATKIIEKSGPVCFLVTTTKHALHAENETRMLSIEVDDSADQTSAVLLKIAETEGLNVGSRDEWLYVMWQDFQRWLAKGNCRVVVPYASVLAKLIEPKSVRLRRDFTQLLMAVKAHVLIHREHRFTNDEGELTANMTDYAAVRELMSDIMAETSGAKIKATVLETVAAVRKLQAKMGSEGVTAQAVGKQLKLDKSSARRRLHGAMDAGLIKNLETRKFQPGLYRTTDVDQDTQELLPTVDELLDGWCAEAENAA